MVDYSPTIIAASLNDEELKKSIGEIVNVVNGGMEKASEAFDTKLAAIEAKFKDAGTKIGTAFKDSFNAAIGGSFDQFAAAMEKVSKASETATKSSKKTEVIATGIEEPQVKSARESYIAFMQGYREQANQLAQLIQNEENRLVKEQQTKVSALGQQIDQNKTKIQELREQMKQLSQEEKNAPTRYGVKDGYRTAIQQTADEINRLISKNKELESEQQRLASTDPLKQQNATLDELRAKRDKVLNIMRDENAINEKNAQTQQHLTQSAKQYSEEVQKYAQMIRESAQWQKTDAFGFHRGMLNINGRSLPVTENLDMGLKLEEQIEQILQRANEERQRGVQISQQQAQASQQIADEDRKAAEALGWVDSPQKKKDYISPTTNIETISELRGALQSITGTQEKWADSIDKTKMSYSDLSAHIKNIRLILENLTEAERNSPAGKVLIQELQDAQRQIRDIQRMISRPVSLSAALGMEEKTIDQISDKINALRAYMRGLDTTNENSGKEIKIITGKIDNLEKKQRELLGTNKSLLESNNALARSWNYMKNRLAFYFTVGASTAFVKNLIEVRSQYEMNERALGILINSAERGTQIFKELSEMALVSPYTLIELSSATKQLVAYGVAAKDVVDTTRRLADMAAAVGIPMERLTYALGQIKAYGYLNSRDQRMFANAGIPLVQELAKHYTELEGRLVTTADVYDRIKKRAVEYGDVVQVINKMTDEGGKFFDYQAKMAETLKVQLANLTLAWNNMLNEIGADTQGMISFGIKGLKQLFLHWRTLDEAIKNAAWTIGFFKSLQFVVLLFGGALKTSAGWTLLLGKRITELAITFGKAFGALAMNPMTWVVTVVYSIISLIRHINQVTEAAREMNRELAKNAKEAADSLDKYLGSESSKTNRAAAKNKSLSELDATKAFEDLRAQIELSSDNANVLIADLLKIGDANERLSKAFDIADKIKEATSLLSGLNDEAFKVSQDSWLNGAFGEGLAEDLEDYVPQVMGKQTWWEKFIYGEGKRVINAEDRNEAIREMENLADDMASAIKERLGARISDPTILNESIERFRKIIKEKNPQIRGEIESWFDVELDILLADRFDKASATTSLSKQFLTVLKRDYASAFANLTSEILKDTATWDKAQIDAIKRAAEELKKTTIPAWHSTIDEMVKYMNRQDWRIRIATEMGLSDESGLQKEWDERTKLFNEEEKRRLQAYKPKAGDTLSKWADEQRKAIQDLDKDINAYEADNSKFSKEQIKRINEEKKARQDALGVFKQSKATKDDINAQKQAESELARTLKEELSLIDKVRSNYKKLTKDGVDAATALSTATSGFDETVERINAVLGKYGIGQLDLKKYAGVSNPKAIMEMLQAQLDALSRSGIAKTSEIKDLQVKLQDLKVESLTFDQQTLTQSLNNELGKLKDEYELAVELDANPELGGVFADMMGLSKEELEKLPRDFEGVVRKLQSVVDKELGMGAFDVRSNLNKDVFDQWVKANKYSQDSDLVAKLKALTEYANKVRLDETKKQIEDWNKLLEKYAEYEYKRTRITQEAERERETARKKNAGSDVLNAIDLRERRELAKLDFEQFQRSPEWITATGDLATLTDKALGTLIKDLEEYKKKAKNLDPKQIKQLNDALKKLRNQQRQGNPFLAIKRAFEEAAEKAAPFNQEVKELTERWMALKRKQSQSDEGVFLTKSELKELDELPQKIDEAQKKAKEVGKVSAQAMVAAINEMLQPINTVTGAIGDMFSAFGNTEASENIQKVTQMLDKAASFAAMGAQIGGGWGAAIGGIVGAIVGGITAWADELSGNADITRQIEYSEKRIRSLENGYKALQKAMDEAYGTAEMGAKQVAIENKKLQLAELERQLKLEQSRSSKNKDEEKISSLKGQIIDLKNEISELGDEITNSFLGISSIGDAVENFVDIIVDALRKGEDAMNGFNDSIDDMIANMLKKFISTRIIGPLFESALDEVDEYIKQRALDATLESIGRGSGRSGTISQAIANLEKILAETTKDEWEANHERSTGRTGGASRSLNFSTFEEWQKYIKSQIEELRKAQEDIGTPTFSDVELLSEKLRALEPILEPIIGDIDLMLEKLGLKETSGEQSLSNLQQGIQGITEDTAGSIEAYMNGVSQQVYLQSDLLTQIRDAIVGFSFDVQLGVQSQILLELQNSYQVQMSIQNILQGVLNPSGRAFMVEMQ